MRRFLTLFCLIGLALPAGVSITGCVRNPAAKFCNGVGYGLRLGQLANITLQPQIAGISLAFGQTTQAQNPSGSDCKGTGVSISSKDFQWGTTNNQLVDISPSGGICAGTWNRNTGGGIADYTYCNNPNPAPKTNGLPYAVAYITATADSVTSNPVAVYVHPQVSSVTLATSNLSSGSGSPTGSQCYSQTQVAQLDAQACFSSGGAQFQLCAPSLVSPANYACALPPGVSSVPTCESAIGTLSFTVGTASVASINATNNQITAQQPGTTAITASIAGSGSSAGYFSTCPPASIGVTLANGATSGVVTQGVAQNLTTTVLDTNGNLISGLELTYQSTNPIDLTAGAGGAISTNFPGDASITAICQPGVCNPAPINQIGLFGTGLSLSSNAVTVTTPGTASQFAWFGAPGASQYFAPVELLTGTVGSTVRMPYVPNSMLMDRGGNNLYFGSARELMIYSTASNSSSTQSTATPGVVLAVAPDNSRVLVNDQARHVFYIVNTAGGGSISFPGMGNAAMWTPDGETLYVTDNAELNTPSSCSAPTSPITGHTNALYVYNVNTGWSTYAVPPSPLPTGVAVPCDAQPNNWNPTMAIQQTPAVIIPSVGAYVRGNPTNAYTWCPSGTVGDASSITFYPQGDTRAVQSDVLAATLDGNHILGAALNAGGTIALSDFGIAIPSTPIKTASGASVSAPDACPVTTNTTTGVQTLGPLTITQTSNNPVAVSSVSATEVNQVVAGSTPTSNSGAAGTGLSFITYNGTATGASLPYYVPSSSGAGTVNYVPLTGASNITGPIFGVFSPDNTLFFVSTAGDNEIHYIKLPTALSSTSTPTDTQQVSPKLPGCDPSTDAGCVFTGTPGAVVPTTVITVKPRSTT
jgi:trimeric autotransporter adhesin